MAMPRSQQRSKACLALVILLNLVTYFYYNYWSTYCTFNRHGYAEVTAEVNGLFGFGKAAKFADFDIDNIASTLAILCTRNLNY
jgi:hypothetical protein